MSASCKLSDAELKQLLVRCLSNDEAAWESLFHSLYGLVRHAILMTGMRDEDMEDAAGDAFLGLIGAVAEVAEARHPAAYIAAMARHAAYRRGRKASRVAEHEFVPETESPDGFLASQKTSHPEQAAELMKSDIEMNLRSALGRIPAAELRLIQMKFVDDFCYDEIAYILGVGASTLRIRVHRAIARIKEAISPDSRAALAENPDIYARILPAALLPGGGGAIDERLRRLLEDLIAEPGEMKPAERREVEQALLASEALREAKVRLERTLAACLDVVGHADDSPMPMPLFDRLMAAVRARTAVG